jgi:hypothetical protein
MATKGVYVLKSQWVWDNTNDEYATIIIEEPEEGFEEIIANRDFDNVLFDELKAIAQAQNHCPMSNEIHMLELYKIEWPYHGKHVKEERNEGGIVELTIRMRLICKFEANKPIPVT